MSEIKSSDAKLVGISVSAHGTVTDPKDFSEGGSEHRKAIIANASLIIVLLSSTKLTPQLFGVSVSVPVLWLLLGISHVYFFCMWRLTATIEADAEKKFWNLKGLAKQAAIAGTREFPGKVKAQLFFIRALPIWAFIGGIIAVACGLVSHLWSCA